jgi:hypothetical protein
MKKGKKDEISTVEDNEEEEYEPHITAKTNLLYEAVEDTNMCLSYMNMMEMRSWQNQWRTAAMQRQYEHMVWYMVS